MKEHVLVDGTMTVHRMLELYAGVRSVWLKKNHKLQIRDSSTINFCPGNQERALNFTNFYVKKRTIIT